jgi:hypothetical protein
VTKQGSGMTTPTRDGSENPGYAAAGTSSGSTGQLARTGIDLPPLLAVAVGCLLVGVGLVLVSGRRRSR